MIESFRVSDALRSIVFNTPSAPNLANPRKGGGERNRLRNLDLWRQVVTHQDTRITLARWNGLRLGGLVSARTTGGRLGKSTISFCRLRSCTVTQGLNNGTIG